MMVVVLVAIVSSGQLGRDTSALVDHLIRRLETVQYQNTLKGNYYYGKQRIKDLGLSIPPHLTSLDLAVGWPGTAVDVLEERIDLTGWNDSSDNHGLSEIFTDNDLDVDQNLAHVDALVYGTSFAAVSSGFEGENDPLVTIESPRTMTVERDRRTRRVSSAISVVRDEAGDVSSCVLFLPDATLSLERGSYGWSILDNDVHNLGRVTVAQFINRPQSGISNGRSEITPTVRGYTDAALRTMLGSEVAREFYAVPQRYLMGAPEAFFFDENGNERGAWDAMMGKILALPLNEDAVPGEGKPTAGAFAANSMDPFFNQVRSLAQMLAAESAIPPTYLGFATDQVASADAIRAMESRLVKRAERRQAQFGRAWTEVARLSVMVRDGVRFADLPPEIGRVRPVWRDASTPTKAATADEVVKLISAQVLTPDGDATYARLGMSEQEIRVLKADKAKDTSRAFARLQEAMKVAPEVRGAANLSGEVTAAIASGESDGIF